MIKSLFNDENEVQIKQKFDALINIFQRHQQQLKKAAQANNFDLVTEILNPEAQMAKLNIDFGELFSGQFAEQFKSLVLRWAKESWLSFDLNGILQQLKVNVDREEIDRLNNQGKTG